MAEFHWIGATGNSIEKFNWNNINNWAVKLRDRIIRGRTFGRLPQGGDTVKIGTDLHCFSPLLYGGYTGGTGSSGQSGLFGNWCQGQTANSGHGSAGYTAGVTGGGIRFVVATDVLAASDSSSISNAIAIGAIDNTTVFSGNANDIWSSSSRIATSTSQNEETVFFNMLASINPHAAGIGLSSQAVTTPEASKYPFPYLGGGITNDIYRYLKATWLISYAGQTSTSETTRAANQWIGGGWTGSESELTTDITKGLTLRLGGAESVGTIPALHISPGGPNGSSVAQNRVFNTVINVVGDKVAGGQIITDFSLNTRGNPLHSYVFKNGTMRTIKSKGDAAILLESCTAGTVETDFHNYMAVSPKSVLGGIVIDTDNNDPRYHPWVLYFSGSLTAGARQATYASGRQRFPWNNIILANTPPATYSNNYANGMSGFSWSSLNPLIGIGEYGGTAGPVFDVSGLSASYYTSVPGIELYSNTESSTTTESDANPANTTYSLEFLGNAVVGSIMAHGANVYYSSKALPDASVYVNVLTMRSGSTLDFTKNPNMDNFFFGGFTGSGNASGLTAQMVGGILFEDDTCIIRPSVGNQFLNNKFIGGDGVQGIDARATNYSPEKNAAFVPSAQPFYSINSGPVGGVQSGNDPFNKFNVTIERVLAPD